MHWNKIIKILLLEKVTLHLQENKEDGVHFISNSNRATYEHNISKNGHNIITYQKSKSILIRSDRPSMWHGPVPPLHMNMFRVNISAPVTKSKLYITPSHVEKSTLRGGPLGPTPQNDMVRLPPSTWTCSMLK